MSPQASCQISCPTSITHLFITPRHVIAGTVPGTTVVQELTCDHQGLENDPHVRIIEAGEMWAMNWHGLSLVTGNADGTARLWNAETGEMVKELSGHGDKIKAILMPSDSTVITGTCNTTHTIRVWDVASGSCFRLFDSHAESMTSLAVLGNRLFSASLDQTVRIWDLDAGTELHCLDGHANYPYIFGFNSDKTLMAIGCGGGDIKIWRVEDGTAVATCRGHTWVVTQFENHNGALMSSAADGTIRIWSWEDGSLLRTMEAHPRVSNRTSAIRGIAWTDRYMITGSYRDGILKAWDKSSNTLISELRIAGISNVVSGEGKVAVSSRAGEGLWQVTLWDSKMIDEEGF